MEELEKEKAPDKFILPGAFCVGFLPQIPNRKQFINLPIEKPLIYYETKLIKLIISSKNCMIMLAWQVCGVEDRLFSLWPDVQLVF